MHCLRTSGIYTNWFVKFIEITNKKHLPEAKQMYTLQFNIVLVLPLGNFGFASRMCFFFHNYL